MFLRIGVIHNVVGTSYIVRIRSSQRRSENELNNLVHEMIRKMNGWDESNLQARSFAVTRYYALVAIQGCCNNSAADGRASWSILKVCLRKSCASDEISDGTVGVAEDPILNIACICVSWAHGCSPVSISTIRQPTLQMSALCVCPLCLTTSGAIQNTEPCREGRFVLLPVKRASMEGQ